MTDLKLKPFMIVGLTGNLWARINYVGVDWVLVSLRQGDRGRFQESEVKISLPDFLAGVTRYRDEKGRVVYLPREALAA